MGHLNYLGKASKEDKEQIYKIWESIFISDSKYLSLIFNELYPTLTPYLYKEDGVVLSTAFAIETTIGTLKGVYIIGVATIESARGRRLSQKVIEKIKADSILSGHSFMIVRPAEPSLFDFYHKQGFTLALERYESLISFSNDGILFHRIPQQRLLTDLTPSAIERIRARIGKQTPIYQWPKEVYKTIINLTLLDRGATYKFKYQNSEEYIIAHRDYTLPNRVIIEECSLWVSPAAPPLTSTPYEITLKAALSINEFANQILYYSSPNCKYFPAGENEKRVFALAAPLTEEPSTIETIKGGFFNFTFE